MGKAAGSRRANSQEALTGANMNWTPMYATPVTGNSGVRARMAGLRHTF